MKCKFLISFWWGFSTLKLSLQWPLGDMSCLKQDWYALCELEKPAQTSITTLSNTYFLTGTSSSESVCDGADMYIHFPHFTLTLPISSLSSESASLYCRAKSLLSVNPSASHAQWDCGSFWSIWNIYITAASLLPNTRKL